MVRRAFDDLRARWQSSQSQDPGVFGSSQVLGGLGGGAYLVPHITDTTIRAQLDSPHGLFLAIAHSDHVSHVSSADCQRLVNGAEAVYHLVPPDVDRALAVRTAAAEARGDAALLVAGIAHGQLHLAGRGDGRAYHVHASGRIDLIRFDASAARPIEPGDSVLLCSPAVSDTLDEYDIALALHSRGPEGAVKDILDASLKRGALGALVAVAFGPQRALTNRLAHMRGKPANANANANGATHDDSADGLQVAGKAQWETWAQHLTADMAEWHRRGQTLGLRDAHDTLQRIEVIDGQARWRRNEASASGDPFGDVRTFASVMAGTKLLEAPSHMCLALQSAARPGAHVSAAALLRALTDGIGSNGSLRIEIGQATSRGLVRDTNEDSVCALVMDASNSPSNPVLLAVADGMGGIEAGEVASALAIDRLTAEAEALTRNGRDPASMAAWVQHSVHTVNAAVVAEAAKRSHEMGTTLAFALIVDGVAYLGNVGDSRIYLWRSTGAHGMLTRLVKDHSLVQALVDAGVLTDEARYSHPERNVVLRSLGEPRMGFSDEHAPVTLHSGDQVLVCSDGLWEMVRDEAIGDVLAGAPNAQVACDRLVALANVNGGEDNVSVVIGAVL